MSMMGEATLPQVGSAVRVLPVAQGAECAGTIAEWTSSPAGLVATARITLDPADVAALSGRRVWAQIEHASGMTVLEAVGTAGIDGAELELTGVLSLATETRRSNPRVGTARRAQLRARAASVAGTPAAGTAARTVDLSRSGARLELHAGTPAPAAEGVVDVIVEVGDHEAVSVTANVVRVDGATVAVEFVDLPVEDAERIDRLVFAELSGQRAAGADVPGLRPPADVTTCP